MGGEIESLHGSIAKLKKDRDDMIERHNQFTENLEMEMERLR